MTRLRRDISPSFGTFGSRSSLTLRLGHSVGCECGVIAINRCCRLSACAFVCRFVPAYRQGIEIRCAWESCGVRVLPTATS